MPHTTHTTLLNLQQSRALERLRREVLRARAAGLYLLADAEGQRMVVTTTQAVQAMQAGLEPTTAPREIPLDGAVVR